MELSMSQEELIKLENYVEGCIPVYAGQIKVGDYILLNEDVCIVNYFTCTKPNKYGPMKTKIKANSIETLNNYQYICNSNNIIMSPIVQNKQYQLIDLNQDHYASLLLPNGLLKQDIKIKNKQLIFSIQKYLFENKEIIVNVTKTIGKQIITKLIIQ